MEGCPSPSSQEIVNERRRFMYILRLLLMFEQKNVKWDERGPMVEMRKHALVGKTSNRGRFF